MENMFCALEIHVGHLVYTNIPEVLESLQPLRNATEQLEAWQVFDG
jgi:hypothetical protein